MRLWYYDGPWKWLYQARVYLHKLLHGHYPLTHTADPDDWECIRCDPTVCERHDCGWDASGVPSLKWRRRRYA